MVAASAGDRARRGIFVMLILLTSMLAGFGIARADGTDSRSFPGCPLLVEHNSGDCVQKLQHYLNAVNSAYSLQEDGKFGPATRIAVLDFQGRNHLGADGNVGGITADTLMGQFNQIPAAATPPGPPNCLDQGMVSDDQGGCVADGVIGGGKSLTACLQDLTIDEVHARVIEKSFTHGQFSNWKSAFSSVKKLAPWITAAQAFKCGWWDLPNG